MMEHILVMWEICPRLQIQWKVWSGETNESNAAMMPDHKCGSRQFRRYQNLKKYPTEHGTFLTTVSLVFNNDID